MATLTAIYRHTRFSKDICCCVSQNKTLIYHGQWLASKKNIENCSKHVYVLLFLLDWISWSFIAGWWWLQLRVGSFREYSLTRFVFLQTLVFFAFLPQSLLFSCKSTPCEIKDNMTPNSSCFNHPTSLEDIMYQRV